MRFRKIQFAVGIVCALGCLWTVAQDLEEDDAADSAGTPPVAPGGPPPSLVPPGSLAMPFRPGAISPLGFTNRPPMMSMIPASNFPGFMSMTGAASPISIMNVANMTNRPPIFGAAPFTNLPLLMPAGGMTNRPPFIAMPATASAASGSNMTEVVMEPTAAAPAGEMMIGLKYENMDLDEVLKQYSEWTGLALMKAPDVPAVKITLKCPKRLPKREALLAIESILAMNNVGLVPMGDKFLKVVAITAARQSGMETGKGAPEDDISDTDHLVSRIVELKHIDTAEAQGVISGLLHGYGKIMPLERVNCLMITDSALNVKRILEILELIDLPIEAREEMRFFPIKWAKASEIQSKIEAIIADSQARDAKNKMIRQQLTTTRMPFQPLQPPQPGQPTIPSVPTTVDITQSATERGLIQGRVKMVADDRINTLIVITRPEQFQFFENIIKVLDQQVEPDVTIKVFRLEYAPAKDIVSVLNNLISSGAKTTLPTVQQPATPTPTPTPTPVPTPTTTTTKETKKETSTAAGEIQLTGRLSSDVKIIADTRINALLIMANKTDMAVIEDVLNKIDIMLSQVLMEVIIIEVDLDNKTKTGVDWLQRSMIAYNKQPNGAQRPFMGFAGTSKAGTVGDIKDATLINAVANNSASASSGLSYYFTIFDLNVDAVINMVESTSKARILSTPIILTTDNKEARIMVGEKRPIVTSTSITSGGTQQSAYEYKDIGIELKVTPHINKKGFVVMEVSQNIDNVGTTVKIDQNEVPVILTREFSASIAVDDRRTIVLGGLVGQSKSKDRTGIPFISNIPLLGLLFRYDSQENQRSELLVLITPYVLDTPEKVLLETKRRHDAMEEGKNLFPTGWSESEVATPSEKEKRDLRKKAEREKSKRPLPESETKARQSPAEVPAVAPAPDAQPAESDGAQPEATAL